jgi:hypothetical protein
MTRIKLLGVALVAAFAFAALSVASAQAADPVLLVCSKVKETGLYIDQNCLKHSETHKGNWELLLFLAGEKIPLKTETKTATLESAVGEVITCPTSTSGGEITSEDNINGIVVKFTECKGHKSGQKEECAVNSTNREPGSGEIVTNTLKGLLGLVAKPSESTSGVGLLLEPESSAVFVTIAGTACSTEATVENNVAGEEATINQATLSLIIPFIGASGVQKIKSIVVLGKTVKTQLKAFGLINASENATATNIVTTALEIM